jgi:hypothetical protein
MYTIRYRLFRGSLPAVGRYCLCRTGTGNAQERIRGIWDYAKAISIAGVLLGGGIVFAASAHADTSEYLRNLREDIPNVVARYSGADLLAEGQKVCDWAAQGVPDVPEGVDRIVADLPMSTSAAISLQTDAETYLGC